MEKVIKAVQKATGPTCPYCGRVLEIHNFSSGGYHFSAGSVWDDIQEDYEYYCTSCDEWIENPVMPAEDDELPVVPF